MAQYTEVKRGQSGAEAEPEEVELRKGAQLVIEPMERDEGVRAVEHMHNHPSDRQEFTDYDEFMEYMHDCCAHLFKNAPEKFSDEEQGENESGEEEQE